MPTRLAPPVGALFTYRDSSYRVNSWLKRMPELRFPQPGDPDYDFRRDGLGEILYETQQKVGPDRCRLMFCTRAEAEYVSGSGVCGCIARITDIEVTGMVGWDEATLREAEASAQRLVGEVVW